MVEMGMKPRRRLRVKPQPQVSSKGLFFDEKAHKYYYDGVPVPSVTGILRDAKVFDYASLNMMWADRGTAIHTVTELDDAGALDTSKVENPLLGPLEGWRKFKTDTNIEVLAIEEGVYHPIYRYAGKLDRRVMWRGKEGIIDIKSGAKAPWHPIQTMGYAKCFDRPMQRFCLYLSSDGQYALEEHKDPSDWDVFRAAVCLASWKRKAGMIK